MPAQWRRENRRAQSPYGVVNSPPAQDRELIEQANEPGSVDGEASDCSIKGNVNSKVGRTMRASLPPFKRFTTTMYLQGERRYFVPGSNNYGNVKIDQAKGERLFCSTGEAEAAGFKPGR